MISEIDKAILLSNIQIVMCMQDINDLIIEKEEISWQDLVPISEVLAIKKLSKQTGKSLGDCVAVIKEYNNS